MHNYSRLENMEKVMPKRQKYEAVPCNAGGGFINGGRLGEIYVKEYADATLIAEALNMMERLKVKRTQCRIEDAISALEVLRDELAAGTA